jgi:hypothetical protein
MSGVGATKRGKLGGSRGERTSQTEADALGGEEEDDGGDHAERHLIV